MNLNLHIYNFTTAVAKTYFKLTNPKTATSTVYPVHNIKIKVRNGQFDRFVVDEVWKHQTYRLTTNPNPQKIRTIVDIGAFIGDTPLWFQKQYPKAKIYAFEPNPENYNLLTQNINQNSPTSIKTYLKAVTSTPRQFDLSNDSLNTGGHSIALSKSRSGSTNQSFGLSQFIKFNKIKHIDILKIDCEGSEYDIILNTPKKMFSLIDHIIVEFHDYLDIKYDFNNIVNFLNTLHFHTKVSQNFFQKHFLKSGIIFAIKE